MNLNINVTCEKNMEAKKYMKKWLNYNLSQFIQNNMFKNYDVNYCKKNINNLKFHHNLKKPNSQAHGCPLHPLLAYLVALSMKMHDMGLNVMVLWMV